MEGFIQDLRFIDCFGKKERALCVDQSIQGKLQGVEVEIGPQC
jgi:hypothetical protein